VKKRIIAIVAVLILLGSAAGSFVAYRHHKRQLQVQAWHDQGLAAQKAGNYPEAVTKLSAYLAGHPDDREVLLAYIDARPRVESPQYRQITDTIRAIRYLLQLDPGRMDYRLKLLDLYQQMGSHTESLETANAILKSDPNNSHALEAKIRALVQLKKPTEARETAKLWAQTDPPNLTAQITKIALDVKAGVPSQDILASLDQWSGAHGLHRYELLKAEAYAALGQKDNCLLWLRKAAQETAPDELFANILVARLAAVGDPGEDVAALRNMVANGAGGNTRWLLIQRLWELGRFKEVVEAAQKMDLTDPSVPVTPVALVAMANSAVGQEAQAAKFKAMLAGRTDSVAAAWVLILGPRGHDVATWRALADLCRKALKTSPGSAYLRFFLGEALEAVGETDLAIDTWEQAAELNQTWGLPLTRLAGLFLDKGDTERAAQAAQAAMRRGLNTPTALVVAHIYATLAGNGAGLSADNLLQLIDQVEKASPGNPEAALLRLEIFAKDGKNDQAVALIHSLLEAKEPPAESLLLKIAEISRGNKLGMEAAILAADERWHGQSSALVLTRALGELAAGRFAAGLQLIDAAAQQAPPANALEWQLIRAHYLDVGNDPAAKAAWKQLAEQNAKDLGVQQGAMAANVLQGDREFLAATIKRMQAILGDDSLVCAMARARLLVATRASDADDVEITDTLKRIITAHPDLPEARVLWAENLEHLGKIDQAIAQLEVAVSARPKSDLLSLRLARLYRANGDVERAVQLLDRVLAMSKGNPTAITLAAGMLADVGELAKATAALEQLGTSASDTDHLMLARLYQRQSQLDKAEAAIAPLLQEPTPAPEVIDFAARLYTLEGKTADATAVMQKLDTAKLAPGQKEMIAGDYAAAAGQADQAIQHYREAIAASPANPSLRQALIVFLFATGRTNEATDATNAAVQAIPTDKSLAAIKHATPILLAVAARPELHSLLLDFLHEPLNSSAVLEALDAVAKASQLHDPLAVLTQARSLSQHYPHFQGVQLWAIAVYLHAGKISDATATIARAGETFPASEDIALVATAFYRTQQRFAEMLDAAIRWRKFTGNPLRPDLAMAQALVGLNRPTEALAQLKPYLAAAQKEPDKQAEILFDYADALRAAGKTAEAAKLLLPLAADHPSIGADCLEFAARRLDPKDGQVWVEQLAPAAKSIGELTRLGQAWAVLGQRLGGKNVCLERATQVFAAIEATSDAPAEALEQAALFAEQAGDDPKAIALYQRTLSLDPKRVIASNNLAATLLRSGGNVQEAAKHAADALAIAPNEPEFLDTMAAIKDKAGDYRGAIQCMQHAIDLQGDNIRWHIQLAQILLDSGQKNDAANALAVIDAMGVDLNHVPDAVRKHLELLRSKVGPAPATKVGAATP